MATLTHTTVRRRPRISRVSFGQAAKLQRGSSSGQRSQVAPFQPPATWANSFKRSMDLILLALAAPFVLPLIGALWLAVKTTSEGPVFYGQRRVGRGGAEFTMWKFRSMVDNAEAVLHAYLDKDPALKAQWDRDHKLKQDPRVTAIGRFLRSSSLDEIPQLWNVLIGEMSIVGPRPIVNTEDYDREYCEEHPEVYDKYKHFSPGITGLWQVSGRNTTTYLRRIICDDYYFRNWSIFFDCLILAKTFRTVLFREGAC